MWEWWQRNRPLLLGAVLLLMALLWYSINLRQQDETNFPERMVLILTGPVQAGLNQVIRGAADVWGHYLYLIDTEQENRALLENNRKLSAILEESGESSVFVVVDNKATRRPVGTGYSDEGMVEITDGLGDNDQVITVGQVGLKDDAVVTVINAVESDPELAESGDTKVSEDATPD